MSEAFDPYHKLLGISKRDQPPTLYRLLGLELFEDDREVIDSAANKQMVYLQGCSNGDRAANAEQLMNEISNARLKLLNSQSKEAYDQQLYAYQMAQQIEFDRSEMDRTDNNAPVVESSLEEMPLVRVDRRKRRKRSDLAQWIAGAIASCLTVWAAWTLGFVDLGAIHWSRHYESKSTNLKDLRLWNAGSESFVVPSENLSQRNALDDASQTGNWSNSRIQAGAQSNNRSRSASASVAPPSDARAGKMGNDPQTEPRYTAEERERMNGFQGLAETSGIAGSTQARLRADGGKPSAMKNPQKRFPVPDEDHRIDAMKAVNAAFASQISAARSPHEKQHLGVLVSDLASETDSPAERYALIQTALSAFKDAGDFNGAMMSIDQLHEQFEIPEFEQRLDIMQKLEPLVYRPLDQVEMADQAETLMERLMLQENYGSARTLCEICQKLSQDLRNKDMTRKFSIKMSEIDTLQSQYVNLVLARKRLESEPNNAKANEYLGRFLCFGKAQWNDGLPYLGQGEDTALRALATDDMRPHATALELGNVADRWWDFSTTAETQPMVVRASQQRAIDTYRRAIAHGLSGLSKAAAEKRITSAQTDPGSDYVISRTANLEGGEPKRPRAVPEEAAYVNGNWYLFSNYRVTQPKADAIAKKAGGRLVVIRSEAEHDFLAKNGKRPLMFGMTLRDGVWYDALNERQHLFLWDDKNRQPNPAQKEVWAAIDESAAHWREFDLQPMYFAIEWGRE